MTQPQNRLLGAPSYENSPPIAPTRAQEPGPAYVAHPRPPAPLVLALTVRPDRIRPDRAPQDVVALRPELLRAIPHLKAGAPVELVAPPRRGGRWYLDTRSSAVRAVASKGDALRKPRAYFNVPALSREHYLLPATNAKPGQFGGAAGTAGLRPFLSFALGPEVPGHPGYFELLPLR